MATTYPPQFVRKTVDGKKVIKDQVMSSNLPPLANGQRPPLHTIRVLTLEGGTVVHGCRDCEFTGSVGEVRTHRNKEHGMERADRRSPSSATLDPDTVGVLPHPSGAMLGMTLYELLELAGYMDRWDTVFTNQSAEHDRLKKVIIEKDLELAERSRELRAAERELKKFKDRLARLIGVGDDK